MADAVECLPSKHEALSSNSSIAKKQKQARGNDGEYGSRGLRGSQTQERCVCTGYVCIDYIFLVHIAHIKI
jgi:hypothetical protein